MLPSNNYNKIENEIAVASNVSWAYLYSPNTQSKCWFVTFSRPLQFYILCLKAQVRARVTNHVFTFSFPPQGMTHLVFQPWTVNRIHQHLNRSKDSWGLQTESSWKSKYPTFWNQTQRSRICWGLWLLSSLRECWHMTMPYLSAGQCHRGNVGILQLIQGAHDFLKGFSVQLFVHNLHLERTHTAPASTDCASAGQLEHSCKHGK